VTLQPIDNDLANFYKLDKVQGALVTDVIKDSPADQGGLKQEDIILNYNNLPVENLSAFRNAVSLMPPGSKLTLKVNRDGKIVTVHVTISVMPDDPVVASTLTQKLGIQVQTLTPEKAQQYNLNIEKGVVITQVLPGSPAAEASLKPGGLIVEINRKSVSNLDEFYAALQDAFKEKRVLLKIRQGDIIRFVAFPVN
jgi:serine protease Do